MFEFDPVAFLQAGAPSATAVIFIVVAFTHLSGRLGLKDNWQLTFALVLGFILGGGLIIATTQPVSYPDWFFALIYALVMAVTPPLLYDQGKELINKAVSRQMGNEPHGRE
jgi:multisubunit Na+/H+ antiporter MnhB subunit